MNENEVWKDVVGYEGLYKVSDRGNVYSVVRIDNINRKRGGRILKPSSLTGGYLRVQLCKNGKVKTKLIHRLVTEAFIPNPEKLPEVNHKDENPSNNELSNLEWCDARHNNNHGTRNERIAHALSKEVRAVNIKNGEVIRFKSTVEAKHKGYDKSTVSLACRGLYKTDTGKLIGGDGRTYRGHRWYYEGDVVE